jgi:release factor glutamine methyltransferase
MADVCTGSGCVAVALARAFPRARLVATDSSVEALTIARLNADRHGVADRIEFLHTDLLRDTTSRFDLIVSNPPYVPARERETLQPEIREFEPPLALFGGPDGLSVIGRLIEQARGRLEPGGLLMFELGVDQEPSVRQLISTQGGLTMMDFKRDLGGIPRVAVVRRTDTDRADPS